MQQLSQGASLQDRCLPWSKPGGLKRPANVCSTRCSSSAGGSFKWGKLYDVAAAKEAVVRNGAVAAVMLLYPDLTPSTRCRPQQVRVLVIHFAFLLLQLGSSLVFERARRLSYAATFCCMHRVDGRE